MQKKHLDQINKFERLLKEVDKQEELLKIYHEYRNFVSLINPKRSLEIAEKGCIYAKTISEKEYMQMLFSKSNSLTLLQRYNESYEILISCLKYYKEEGSRIMIIKTLGAISNILSFLELFPQAIYILNTILYKLINPEEKALKFITKLNLIQIYIQESQNIPFSIEELEELLEYEEVQKLSNAHPNVILNLSKGILYFHNEAFSNAIDILEGTLSYCNDQKIEFLVNNIQYYLGITYKKIKEFKKMEHCFKNIIHYSNKINNSNLMPKAYLELYQYYTEIRDDKKALECFENYQLFKSKEDKLKLEIKDKIQKIGFSGELDLNNELFYKISEDYNLETNGFYIRDLKGNHHLVSFQDILFAEKQIDILKIYFSIDKPIYTKMSFKEFLDKINLNTKFNNLFFEIQQRSTIVNLFWFNKMNTIDKKIILKGVNQDFELNVSKRQYPLLKKHLLTFNIIM
jgi:tetratricopeptide (TPR) repeat protein